MILYIGSNNIYLLSNDFSQVLYEVHKSRIDYSKLISLIGKNKLLVFINSFFSISEHKTFKSNTKKQEIKSFIENRFRKPDVVCASHNRLFSKLEGGVHKNDIIMTIIKENENEIHIKKIINELMKTDLDLSHIYSFDQAINTIGISYLSINRYLNVNVIILDDGALIIVSNTTHYMFSRLIKERNNETILETTAKMLAMTLKYIGTTYSFIQNEVKITVLSTDKDLDIEKIKTLDPVFETIVISKKILDKPSLKIKDDIVEDMLELQLLKIALPEIKNVNNLTNVDLSIHINVHRFIKILRIFSITLLLFSIFYGIYKYVIGTTLSQSDKDIETQYIQTIQDAKNKEKKLIDLSNKIYSIVATNVSKNIEDNSHLNCVKLIASVLKKYRKFVFVEAYRFDCSNCLSSKRKNILYIDIALFNVNMSSKFVINELSKIETDIRDMFSKLNYDVDVNFQQLSHNRHIASSKDFRDTMIITFQKK